MSACSTSKTWDCAKSALTKKDCVSDLIDGLKDQDLYCNSTWFLSLSMKNDIDIGL